MRDESWLTPELIQVFVGDLNLLPVALDDRGSAAVVFDTTQALCRKHGLTAYDAAYLEIAMFETCALATVDEQLKRAAVAEGVEVL